jgi:hypothetical protein
MKPISTVFILIILQSFSSFGQEKTETVKEGTTKKNINFFAGMHGGPTHCTYYTSKSEILRQYTLTPRTGVITGFFVQKDINTRLAWTAELDYELITYTMTPDKILRNVFYTGGYHYYYSQGPLQRIQVNNNLIRVPLSLEYKITAGRAALFIRAGGYINTTLRSCTTRIYENPMPGSKYIRDKDWTNPRGVQYGAVGGLGLDRKLSDRLHFIIEIRDHVALNNIKTEETNAIGLLVGLMYK